MNFYKIVDMTSSQGKIDFSDYRSKQYFQKFEIGTLIKWYANWDGLLVVFLLSSLLVLFVLIIWCHPSQNLRSQYKKGLNIIYWIIK